jgi:hypothetical protein
MGPVYSGPSYSGTPQSYYSGQPGFSSSTTTTVTRSDGFVTQYAPGSIVQTPVVTSVPPGYRTDACTTGQIAYGQEYVICSGNWVMTDNVIISDVAPQYRVQPVIYPAPVVHPAPAPTPIYQPPQQQFAMAPAAMTGGVGIDIGGGYVGGGGSFIVTGGSSSVAARSPIPIVLPPRGRPHAPPPPCGGGCGHPPPPPPPPCGGGCGHGH